MELAELTAYAGEKYHIAEQHKWSDFPGFSVLCHPQTGKWVALLMRQWDTDTGVEIQRCDMKCGSECSIRFDRPYLSAPIRMKGKDWINIAFDERTEREVVFRLLDRAIALGSQNGYTIVLDSSFQDGRQNDQEAQKYQETALPFAGSFSRPEKEKLPEKLREMRHLYTYGRESAEARAENFYRQAVFMQDYEDDFPWSGDFYRYFPTYHDLTTRQLRGYFSWRTRLRRGDFRPIATSAAYIYVYELLNGIGAASPEESLKKLQEFEKGYVDSGVGDACMRQNLHRWMLEYAVLRDLPPEVAVQAADPDMMKWDSAVASLRRPESHSDEDVFSALCFLCGKKTESSPVVANDPERGKRLFSEVWRAALSFSPEGTDLFTLCFGKMQMRRWYPLSNTVYYEQDRQGDREYALDECRHFRCKNGIWQLFAYEKLFMDRKRLRGFLHETDAKLRRYLKTGRYLRENAEDEWVVPYIDAVIEEERKALLEAARPKITIDLSDLDRIRRDALVTQESLLVEEEPELHGEIGPEAKSVDWEKAADIDKAEDMEGKIKEPMTADKLECNEMQPPAEEPYTSDLPLDPVQLQILRALLAGQDAAKTARENHLMPSVAADSINEALFDEFGDTVILCEGDILFPVEDYIEDLRQYLGGTDDGDA